MYLCLRICVSLHLCIYVSMCLCVCVYVSMYLYIYVPLYLCIYVSMYVLCVCARSFMYACMCMCVCMCVRIPFSHWGCFWFNRCIQFYAGGRSSLLPTKTLTFDGETRLGQSGVPALFELLTKLFSFVVFQLLKFIKAPDDLSMHITNGTVAAICYSMLCHVWIAS